MKVHEIPEVRAHQGTSLVNLLALDGNEKVNGHSGKGFDENGYLYGH